MNLCSSFQLGLTQMLTVSVLMLVIVSFCSSHAGRVSTLVCVCRGSECRSCLTFSLIYILQGQYCSSLHQYALTPALFNALLQFINGYCVINISAGETHRSPTLTALAGQGWTMQRLSDTVTLLLGSSFYFC